MFVHAARNARKTPTGAGGAGGTHGAGGPDGKSAGERWRDGRRVAERGGGAKARSGWPFAIGCAASAAAWPMNFRSLTPRVREALRQLASGPQDMRDDALLQQINDEMKKLSVEEIAHVRDRVRFSCPPCPMVQSVLLMLEGLIEVKKLNL